MSVRCGGHGEELVGQTIPVKKKNKQTSYETLGAVVKDYGPGDVCIFKVKS